MDLDFYKGKKFKYNSSVTGVSSWSAEAIDVFTTVSFCDFDLQSGFHVNSSEYKVYVKTSNQNVYEFDKCIWLN